LILIFEIFKKNRLILVWIPGGCYYGYMPELPEVETVVRGLAGRLIGCRIASVHLSRKALVHGHALSLKKALCGCRIKQIDRRGKQIWIELDANLFVMVHLGMTGRLFVSDGDSELVPHTHMRITFRGRRAELRFCDPRRFGGLWLMAGGAGRKRKWKGRPLPPVGTDALSISLSEFRRLLKRNRQIKALLLDQRAIAGMGNIYCDESLHRVGIHPLTRACDLDDGEVGLLHRQLRRVLNEAIRARGSSVSDYRTADNDKGTYQHRHRVYGRKGLPCRRCGSRIEKFVAAGRGTHICPKCQDYICK